jgi:cell division protein FtsW
VLAIVLALLVVGGALIFSSAAFGLLARGTTGMSSVVFNHLVLGVGLGLVLMFITMHVDYHRWRPLSPYLFVGALILTALVFVPHVGAVHGGGRRWIILFHLSLQPSEALKIGGVMFAAAYFASIKSKVATIQYGLGGFLAILALPATMLVLQPDLGTLGVVVIGVGAIFIAAGARFRDIAIVLVLGILALGILVIAKPYVRDRVMTFFQPSQGQQAEGYQIKQSLIAIGSGGVLGRGFGQGIQKFTYLPEPMGDSIFAVAGEELGFVGTTLLIFLFLALALRGLAVSARAPDAFGSLLGIGIASYLACEAFINIASMVGVAPLTGIPLTFVSQGGSAMLVSLASAGILLNISKSSKRLS